MRAKLISTIAAIALISGATHLHARAGGGSVNGKVTYEGTPAKPKPIDMSKEPSCQKQHATPVTTETVVTGPNNSLENVVVYVSAGAPDDTTSSTGGSELSSGISLLRPYCLLRSMATRQAIRASHVLGSSTPASLRL